jgi:hypothetical protein
MSEKVENNSTNNATRPASGFSCLIFQSLDEVYALAEANVIAHQTDREASFFSFFFFLFFTNEKRRGERGGRESKDLAQLFPLKRAQVFLI